MNRYLLILCASLAFAGGVPKRPLPPEASGDESCKCLVSLEDSHADQSPVTWRYGIFTGDTSAGPVRMGNVDLTEIFYSTSGQSSGFDALVCGNDACTKFGRRSNPLVRLARKIRHPFKKWK